MVPKSSLHSGAERIASPTRQPPRRSIPPEALTEVVTIPTAANDREIELSQEAQAEDNVAPKPVVVESSTVASGKRKVSHVNDEEEIERQRGIWIRKVRLLRGECESLEGQLNQARQNTQNTNDAREKAARDVNSTMYHPLLLLESLYLTF